MTSEIDFGYAYWVDDHVGLRRIQGVALGFHDKYSGQSFDGVITPEAARDLGEQLLAIADEMEDV